MIREIQPGIHWLHEPHSYDYFNEQYEESAPDWFRTGTNVQLIINAFLIEGDQTLLFDTLTPVAAEQVISEVEEILGDRELDYLVLSHPEPPHAGNTHKIVERYPSVTVVAPKHGDKHDLYYFDDAVLADYGDTIDLGGFVVEFLEPPFVDHPMTHWMFERTTETLFVVDWLAFNANEDEQLKFVDEIESELTLDRLCEMNGPIFYWFTYANPDKTDRAIEKLIHAYQPKMLAPAHGLVFREDCDRYMRMMKDVIREVGANPEYAQKV